MKKEELFAIFRKAKETGASDIHFNVGEVPVLRLTGKMVKINLPKLTAEDAIDIINYTTNEEARKRVLTSTDSDYSFELEGVSRFRFNVAKSFGAFSIVIRLISFDIPSFESLKLPKEMENFTKFENGIILVTGVTGSGKSSTIASILDSINQTKQKHIITIEDPVEFVYQNKKSVFTQRQVGADVESFNSGLKYALRQDPDVILIGEIRDMDTIKSALYAAETGHLVLASLHAANAIQTINRVLSFFEPSERPTVRAQFAEVFRGTASQRLIPHISGKGRVPALELMFTTPTVKDYMIKDRLEDIYRLVQKDTHSGMITFNNALYTLIQNGEISQEVALQASDNQDELMRIIRGAY